MGQGRARERRGQEMFHLKISTPRAIERMQIMMAPYPLLIPPSLISLLPSPYPSPLSLPPIPPIPPPMSRTLTHPSALSAHSDSLSTRTNQLSLALSQSITARAPLDDALGRLRALVPEVARLRALVDGDGEAQGQGGTLKDAWGYDDAHEQEEEDQALRLRRGARRAGLVGRVSAVYETSESVGGKVRVLDARVGRVRHAVEIVGEVIEFKVSLGVRDRGVMIWVQWERTGTSFGKGFGRGATRGTSRPPRRAGLAFSQSSPNCPSLRDR